MGVDIDKIFGYAGKVVPLIITAMTAVAKIKGASGPEKKDAVMSTIIPMLGSVEYLVGDFADDDKVRETADKLVEAIYAFDKALRLAREAKGIAKQIPNKTEQ